MTPDDMVSAVKLEGGFDTNAANLSSATLLSWVNEKYREMVARAKWQKATTELGPTVAATSQYALTDAIVEVCQLRVAGSDLWLRGSTEELFLFQNAHARLFNAPGVFAENFKADGTKVVELWPTPTVSGLAISVLVAQQPSDLALSGASAALPTEFHQPIVDGAIAVGLQRVYERPELAAPYDKKFEDALERLRRRGNSRIGSGPVRIKVAGRR